MKEEEEEKKKGENEKRRGNRAGTKTREAMRARVK
jgi:hypothetical protein